MKKVGLFFGSFNPIHTGHLILASSILNYCTDIILNQILFVVSPHNPLKSFSDLAPFQDRYNMVIDAILKMKQFDVTDIESKMPTPSFTCDTVQVLKEKYPENEFHIIMGQDCFNDIHKWKNFETLLNPEILVYPRIGYEPNSKFPAHYLSNYIKFPLIDISSTAIRNLIKEDKIFNYLIPDSVVNYIKNENLYK
jgi:nicotinate-nucleotide adenylyltransferase